MKKCVFWLVLLLTFSLISNAVALDTSYHVYPTVSYPSSSPTIYYYPTSTGPSTPPSSVAPPSSPSSGSAPKKASNGYYYSGSLGSRTLKRTYPCMRGSDVRTLQTMLNALGYRCGRADGVFGDRTQAAVKAFQRANGLKVDGIVGRATKARLMSRYRGRR